MRIEQLEYVAAAIEHGSLRRASEHLHVSQPALSEGIMRLERELGVALLERHRAGARASAAGRLLLPHILEALDALARVRAAARDDLAVRRALRIGTVNAGTASLLLPATHAVQQQHPSTAVEIRNLQQSEIMSGITEGSLDLGVVNLLRGDDVPPDLTAVPLLIGRPVAVLPTSHPLAAQAAVEIDQLRQEPFVGMREGYVMFRFAHRLFGPDLPTTWHTTDGADMGKLMVAEGIGVTVLPSYSVFGDPLERAGVITGRPINNGDTSVTMVAVYRRQQRLPAVVRDVLTELHRIARGFGADAEDGRYASG